MSSEIEAEGEILRTVLADLGAALGVVADRPVASAAPPEVGNALDKTVRGFGHGGAYAVQRAMAASDLADPRVAQMEKIIGEVMADYQKLGSKLSVWWLDWLSRRRDELDRGDRADREPVVEEEVYHGAD